MQRFVCLFDCLFSCLFWYPGTAFLVDLGKYCIPILILDFFPPLFKNLKIVGILIGKSMPCGGRLRPCCLYNYL